ncbi:MAG: GGDEF domain-containing phosphodiesterase, partial [Clostridiales bacterium]
FEKYNALYGFQSGNCLLCKIAQIMQKACRKNEICARIFADHFICLMTANNMKELQDRFHIINNQFHQIMKNKFIIISYGFYAITDRSLLIRTMADHALTTKRTIKGNYLRSMAVYDEELHQRQIEEAELIANMEESLSLGEFIAVFQPKYDIHTEKIVGAEALVRWKHANGKIDSPIHFIPLFEKNGLICKLDCYMFEMICQKLALLLKESKPLVPIAVNFSRAHLYELSFADKLMSISQKYNVPTQLLEIEFTESAFIDNQQALIYNVNRLHKHGFLVAIDDFGSGFSSLNMLKDISFDIMKIDRGFLSSITQNSKGEIIIKNMLTLAHDLNLQTVAEGVETAEQLALLKEKGCNIVQGFYFSKPISEEEFDLALAKQAK